jgi:hypothetical protein
MENGKREKEGFEETGGVGKPESVRFGLTPALRTETPLRRGARGLPGTVRVVGRPGFSLPHEACSFEGDRGDPRVDRFGKPRPDLSR